MAVLAWLSTLAYGNGPVWDPTPREFKGFPRYRFLVSPGLSMLPTLGRNIRPYTLNLTFSLAGIIPSPVSLAARYVNGRWTGGLQLGVGFVGTQWTKGADLEARQVYFWLPLPRFLQGRNPPIEFLHGLVSCLRENSRSRCEGRSHDAQSFLQSPHRLWPHRSS